LPIIILIIVLGITIFFFTRVKHPKLTRVLIELAFSIIIYWGLYSLLAEIELSGGQITIVDNLIVAGISIAPVLLLRLIVLLVNVLTTSKKHD